MPQLAETMSAALDTYRDDLLSNRKSGQATNQILRRLLAKYMKRQFTDVTRKDSRTFMDGAANGRIGAQSRRSILLGNFMMGTIVEAKHSHDLH